MNFSSCGRKTKSIIKKIPYFSQLPIPGLGQTEKQLFPCFSMKSSSFSHVGSNPEMDKRSNLALGAWCIETNIGSWDLGSTPLGLSITLTPPTESCKIPFGWVNCSENGDGDGWVESLIYIFQETQPNARDSPGADPRFWSGGPSRVVTPRGPWAQHLLKIGVLPLKLPENYIHGFEEILRARGPPWIRHCSLSKIRQVGISFCACKSCSWNRTENCCNEKQTIAGEGLRVF